MPRADLLKVGLFAASVSTRSANPNTASFGIGNAALLMILLPAPLLFGFPTTKRDVATELWPALVARLLAARKRREGPRGAEAEAAQEQAM